MPRFAIITATIMEMSPIKKELVNIITLLGVIMIVFGCFLVFGKETKGLPNDLIEKNGFKLISDKSLKSAVVLSRLKSSKLISLGDAVVSSS